jgi:hypothetical protein
LLSNPNQLSSEEMSLMVKQMALSIRLLNLPAVPRTSLFVLFLILMAACDRGPRLVKLEGTVQVDGQPANGVTMLFYGEESSTAVASAISGEDGSFTPTTEMRPGIPEGKYRVAASWPDPNFVAPKMPLKVEPPAPPDLLKDRYTFTNTDAVIEASFASPEVVLELTTKK